MEGWRLGQGAGVDTSGVETSGVETSGVDTSGVETSGVETSGVDTSGLDRSLEGVLPGRRHPSWIRSRAPGGAGYNALKQLVGEQKLHTVCESAACPNIGECWANRTLTIMILGNICTRSCRFCNVATGRPLAVDEEEPARVARTLASLKLKHAVITSVNRDELKDGGARIWAATLRAVREACPEMTLEALIGDFKGREVDLDVVFAARPDILAHNVETVPRLSKQVRKQARYERSLGVLSRAHDQGLVTKSSLMLGLGEELEEVQEVMVELRRVGCELMTLGQYLRPTPAHLPVVRYVPPETFQALAAFGQALGFRHVEAGPLVRSSYHAERQARGHFAAP